MNIRGITVSVNYADLLSVGLDRWDTGLDDILVVTSKSDKATQDLCKTMHVPCYQTDVFYANGAKFNKGAALSEAIINWHYRRNAEWFLVFDSDIVPPDDWRHTVERQNPVPGRLYGAHRYENPENYTLEQCSITKGPRIPASWVIGFFSLFHADDPRLPSDPMFECHWTHAGNFDTSFSWRWPHRAGPDKMQTFLDLHVVHLGMQRQHWLGRGKPDELRQMLGKRRHFHDVAHERIEAPAMPEVT